KDIPAQLSNVKVVFETGCFDLVGNQRGPCSAVEYPQRITARREIDRVRHPTASPIDRTGRRHHQWASVKTLAKRVRRAFRCLGSSTDTRQPVRQYKTLVGIDNCIQARWPVEVKLLVIQAATLPYSVLPCRT